MPLNNTVRCDGYIYSQQILSLSPDVVKASQRLFEKYREQKIISADSYYALVWELFDGVHRPKRIRFAVNELNFERKCKLLLGCTHAQYQETMRVMVTGYLGASGQQLQTMCSALCSFANNLTESLPQINSGLEHILLDFLTLLPGDTPYRNSILDQIEDLAEQRISTSNYGPRSLRYYQSYFKFDYLLKDFWNNKSSRQDRVLYFPVYLWWNLTAILPLRPTEFTIIPRDCLKQENGKNYITVRRTRLKGSRFSARYSLEEDYEKKTYQIPGELADAIKTYIQETTESYTSDIDSLFSKNDQFRLLPEVHKESDHHFTYANLSQCLAHFYNKIMVEKLGMDIVADANGSLLDNEIEKISLGDTRHIAMISLMISGQSPVVCQELAGHDCLEIGANYYSNLKNFADALSYEYVRKTDSVSFEAERNGLIKQECIEVENGYCYSNKTLRGNFSDCEQAVDDQGRIGTCSACRHFLKKGGRQMNEGTADDGKMRDAFLLIRKSIAQVRHGLAFSESIESAIMRFQAEASHYVSRMAILHETEER